MVSKDPGAVGPWLRVASRSAKWLVLFIAIPPILSMMRTGSFSLVNLNSAILTGIFVAFFVVATALLTRARTNWGDSLLFGDSLAIQRPNKPSLVITRQDMLRTIVRPGNCFLVSYSDGVKKRVIIIGSEGFTSESWAKLEAAAANWASREATTTSTE